MIGLMVNSLFKHSLLKCTLFITLSLRFLEFMDSAAR